MKEDRIIKKRNNIIKNLRCYFIILNLVFGLIAFSGLVSGQSGCALCDKVKNDIKPSTTSNPTSISNKGDIKTTTNGDLEITKDQLEIEGDDAPADSIGKDNSDTGDNRDPGSRGPGPRGGGSRGPGTVRDGAGEETIFEFLNNQNLYNIIWYGTIGAGIFGTIGALAGGDDGAQWGALAGAIGGAVAGLAENAGYAPGTSLILGLVIATAIFIYTYTEASTQITEFHCLPWQAPIGGQDCTLCNEFEECSEYTCKSLGQACEIVNQGTEEQRCVWVNPHDVNSPTIEFKEVSKNHQFRPDNSIRPPATGVIIKPVDQECIRAFFPLEFTFITNEPAQCKIDYNLTTTFEDMNFFVNGNNLFIENHTETLSLPGPEALNLENPQLRNNGEYTLFIRCKDANGNFNQDAYSVNFCVEKGPDTTPPIIVEVNIPSGNPVQFNQTSFNLEVYINEPSECKWSRTDQSFDNMETDMDCDTRVFQMNNKNLYTCRTTLTGIQDRKDNNYFFRCKDQPLAPEGDRNVNSQSFPYVLVGTQPLNILSVEPNETIKGAADVLPVFLEIRTDNGYSNGDALCYFYNDNDNSPPKNDEDYVLFHETKSSQHTQRQDLVAGDYTYFFKCVDLGGNAAYTSTSFGVETDRLAPKIIRAYRETDLKIITDEKAECTYSNTDCNFEIESGIEMSTIDNQIHNAEWVLNRNYYIRCKDKHDNQPFPNVCSIILRPSQTLDKDYSDGWEFSF